MNQISLLFAAVSALADWRLAVVLLVAAAVLLFFLLLRNGKPDDVRDECKEGGRHRFRIVYEDLGRGVVTACLRCTKCKCGDHCVGQGFEPESSQR